VSKKSVSVRLEDFPAEELEHLVVWYPYLRRHLDSERAEGRPRVTVPKVGSSSEALRVLRELEARAPTARRLRRRLRRENRDERRRIMRRTSGRGRRRGRSAASSRRADSGSIEDLDPEENRPGRRATERVRERVVQAPLVAIICVVRPQWSSGDLAR